MGHVSGPIGPNERQQYEHDYRQGANLFQQALNQYNHSSNPYQKAEFKKVMDQALNALNDSAHGLMRQELEKQTQQIARDYAIFQKFPEDPDTIQKLKVDLEEAKKSLG